MSTMTVGDRTMRIQSDGLVEQKPIRRQVGAPASDGTDGIVGSPGTARRRGIHTANQRLLDDLSDEGRPRHLAPPRFPRERGVLY